ncbi:DUF2092 domain-containing protein [Altererythrobacter salegens]|uniref:DUF2092 domain-containing protein n=1 Tax=Croceibacterium salegens TaxID=1737568 RepID=A0A6I4SSP7_9SPHN|nr:DUF2092 domain-containing protein [Croceibacterium salegens]MXO58569.1 DUF2092 domain-containing protein [Croceibacterium salegens]
MKRTLIAALLMASAAPAMGQSSQPQAQDDPARVEAVTALDELSARLRTLDQFEVNVNATTEEVFTNGEKLQFLNQVRYVVDRPDKLYVSVRSDRKYRRIYYNGSNLTVTAPTTAYYATVPMTGSIHDLLVKANDQFGIDVPLEDLFLWGIDGVPKPVLTEAFLVGFAQIGDYATDQYFYRTAGVDWQIWIGRDDKLPYRMVITNTDDPAQPTYSASLTWNLAPNESGDPFTFTPSSDYKLVPLRPDQLASAN